ncbi:helix-turn-helix transcriptional regulator [Methylocapsa sp. D3K7]|uniref:AraC family transcriptional regulator n=1 Tax=Methylocapsa sp. D3K7 TaxID=3041435 RepID=UPI00244EDBC5|nr:helix-turn-helix transcriptional regulator [Methylocapsa sp. D3K7]WGJ13233.1 helix-turn-helix transcriptional regulator [Methylocapsa sp. D3K7]
MTASCDGYDVRTLAARYHAGTTLAAHHHAWGQLVFAASGVMRVIADGAAWLIPPTRAIWLQVGVRHTIAMQGEVAMRTHYINVPRAASLPSSPCVLEVAPLLRELIFHILGIGMLATDRIEHDQLAGLLIDLIIAAGHENLMLPLPRDPRALRMAEHWQQHPDDRHDLSELAQKTGASLRTLQRLFPRETGFTLEAWRQKARLIHAVAQLAAGTSMTNAALDCGYQSAAAFGVAFSHQFGVSPARYITRR